MFIVNVEGAIRKDNKWIIIERSKKEEHAGGGLSLVGGKVELEKHPSNILEKTLKREIFEEIGVTVKENLKYLHSTSFVTEKGDVVIDIIFLCEYDSGDFYAKQPDEVENVFLLTTEEILNNPQIAIFVKEYINYAALAL